MQASIKTYNNGPTQPINHQKHPEITNNRPTTANNHQQQLIVTNNGLKKTMTGEGRAMEESGTAKAHDNAPGTFFASFFLKKTYLQITPIILQC